MTFVAKLFLMMNLAVSFMMAVIAFGLYATGLDYDAESKGKSQTPQPPARWTAVRNEIDQVLSTMTPVEGTWRAARTDLLAREDQRRKNHDWYDREMARLGNAKASEQLSTLKLAGHLPVLGVDNFPTLVPAVDLAGLPLRGLNIYTTQLETARKENKDVMGRLEEQIKKDIDLTNQLTGTVAPFKKGLRQQVIDERHKRDDIDSEYRSVRPLSVNVAVESELTRKRYESMQEDIARLKRYLLKKHKVGVAMRGR